MTGYKRGYMEHIPQSISTFVVIILANLVQETIFMYLRSTSYTNLVEKPFKGTGQFW